MREDWVEVRIIDVFDVSTGNTPSKKENDNYNGVIPFIKPPNLWNSLVTEANEFLTEKGAGKSRVLPPLSTLVTCIGNIGRVGINKNICAFNQQINAIKPVKFINPWFTFFQAQNPAFKIQLEAKSSATTVAILNKGNFETVKIVIAPLPEQRAIVSKIEQLFSSLDSGIADLKKAQTQLTVYRQAVLKKAFEGEFTKEWREKQANLPTAEELLIQIKEERENHYKQKLSDWKEAVINWEASGKEGKKPGKPRALKKLPISNEKLFNVPAEWKSLTIDWFLSLNKKGMTTGPFGTLLKKSEHKSSGIPVLGIENIGVGVFQMPNKIFVSNEKAKELSSFEVEYGDIIISRSGTVGEICAITKSIGTALISTNLIRVSLNKGFVDSKYFVYLFQGGVVLEQVRTLCAGSTRDFLNQTILSSIDFPIPSKEEQCQIVQEIESRLSVCDKVEETIKTSLLKAEALRQSILKKAFEGKLLSEAELKACREEEDWEPAEKLLARIKETQKENSKKTTKK